MVGNDALGVNDSLFDLTIRVADDIGGMVRVEVGTQFDRAAGVGR